MPVLLTRVLIRVTTVSWIPGNTDVTIKDQNTWGIYSHNKYMVASFTWNMACLWYGGTFIVGTRTKPFRNSAEGELRLLLLSEFI